MKRTTLFSRVDRAGAQTLNDESDDESDEDEARRQEQLAQRRKEAKERMRRQLEAEEARRKGLVSGASDANEEGKRTDTHNTNKRETLIGSRREGQRRREGRRCHD